MRNLAKRLARTLERVDELESPVAFVPLRMATYVRSVFVEQPIFAAIVRIAALW